MWLKSILRKIQNIGNWSRTQVREPMFEPVKAEAFVSSNAFIGKEIYSRIEVANFLANCGEPHPDDPAVSHVESLDRALEIIAGSQLDATPHSNWDKTLTTAFRESRVALKRQKGRLAALYIDNPLRERESRITALVKIRMKEASVCAKLKSTGNTIVESHLTELLLTASLILDADRGSVWPLIIKAADLALQGYLPVDFAIEPQGQRVFVY